MGAKLEPVRREFARGFTDACPEARRLSEYRYNRVHFDIWVPTRPMVRMATTGDGAISHSPVR